MGDVQLLRLIADKSCSASLAWLKNMWVCLKMVSTPKPNGFADHYPVFKWLFHWEYTLFSDKPMFQFPGDATDRGRTGNDKVHVRLSIHEDVATLHHQHLMGWWPRELMAWTHWKHVCILYLYYIHIIVLCFFLQWIVYIYIVIHRYFNSLHILLISSIVSLLFVLCKYIFTFDPPPVMCMYSNIFVHTYQMRMMPHVYRCKRELLICRTWSHHFGVLNPITQTRFGP